MTGFSRRRFVQGVGVAGLGLVGGGALQFSAAPPAAKVHRIGYLTGGPPNASNEVLVSALLLSPLRSLALAGALRLR